MDILKKGFLIICCLYCVNAYSQLDTIRVVSSGFSEVMYKDGGYFYIIKDKIHIEKPDWNKLLSNQILEQDSTFYLMTYYDEAMTILHSKSLVNGKSRCGTFVEYYPNGKIKKQGSYSGCTSTSAEWNIPVGEWSYYNENGKLSHNYTWKNGEVSEGKKWESRPPVGLTIKTKDEVYNGQSITRADLKDLSFEIDLADYNVTYGRFKFHLLITGQRMPLKDLYVDYTVLPYFDWYKFYKDNAKDSSNLMIEFKDEDTGVYFSQLFIIDN